MFISSQTSLIQFNNCLISLGNKYPIFPILKQSAFSTLPGYITCPEKKTININLNNTNVLCFLLFFNTSFQHYFTYICQTIYIFIIPGKCILSTQTSQNKPMFCSNMTAQLISLFIERKLSWFLKIMPIWNVHSFFKQSQGWS